MRLWNWTYPGVWPTTVSEVFHAVYVETHPSPFYSDKRDSRQKADTFFSVVPMCVKGGYELLARSRNFRSEVCPGAGTCPGQAEWYQGTVLRQTAKISGED